MIYLQSDEFMIWSFSIMIGVVLVLWILKFASRLKRKKMDIRTDEKGFTLIELVIVIAIISVLALIAIPQFASYRTRGFDSIAQEALRNAVLFQEAYYIDNDTYASEGSSSEIEALSDDVILTIEKTDTTYQMVASHINSNNMFLFEGPGGTIQLIPSSP